MRLRKFNANRESKKLSNRQRREYQVKTRTMILSIGILICSIILCTYAAFSSTGKVDVVHSNVGNLVQTDYEVKIYIDGTISNTLPDKDDGYSVDYVSCTNGAKGYWNYTNWALMINNAEEPTVCSIYFTSFPGPELYQGLIPVTYDNNGHTVVADPNDYYDYDDHEWANAVLVGNSSEYFDSNGNLITSKIGQTIDNDILQYYVWIPRYKYELFNAVVGDTSNEQMINIEFENKSKTKSNGDDNGEWLTHPAFTFGSTELNGFWVGKFEMTGEASTSSDPTSLTILPNVQDIHYMLISSMFTSLRDIDTEYSSYYGLEENEIDTHMMKNMEWGAVTYLSSSEYGRYNSNGTCVSGGCNVWPNTNNIGDYVRYTGCAGDAATSSQSTACNEWNTSLGVHASTTDNQYGIYDMKGGAWEYTMAYVSYVDPFTFNDYYNRFSSIPLDRYIDKYVNSYPEEMSINAISNGKLGDATREVEKQFDIRQGSWYGGRGRFPHKTDTYIYEYFIRGGCSGDNDKSIFSFEYLNGAANNSISYRAILSAQDGNYNGNGLS